MDPTALVLIFVELLSKVDQQLPRKTSPLYKIGKFRHLLAYIGRIVFPIREPGRLYQNRETPGEIGRLERYALHHFGELAYFIDFYTFTDKLVYFKTLLGLQTLVGIVFLVSKSK